MRFTQAPILISKKPYKIPVIMKIFRSKRNIFKWKWMKLTFEIETTLYDLTKNISETKPDMHKNGRRKFAEIF